MIDLAPEHLKTVKRILAEIVPDCEVRAFGSRATWTAKEHSDLDLVISSPEPLAWDRRSRLCEAFEESDLPIRVDVVDWESLSDGFRQSIDGDCVVLQERSTSGNWRETTLGEVIELKRGYDLPKRKRVSGSVPLISSSGTSDYHAEAKVMGPGVVTGRYGTLGQVYYIQDDFWPLNTTLYVRDFKGNNPRFISYLLRSIDFFAYSDKAAVPGVNRNHLHTAPVRIPPLDEQRRIAHILGTLDDKIELNRRMGQTLEAMAQALFKSWFVDFDPVRAKAEGRPTNLPPDLDALFPDSFQDSELGEIPEGWEVGALGDLIELAYGKALRAIDRRPGDVPVYGSNGQIGWHDRKLANGPGIVVGRKGNPGVVKWSAADFFPIDTTFYVVPCRQISSLHFLFFLLREQDLPGIAADSAVPGLNRNLAYMDRVTTPPIQLVELFEIHVGALFARSHSLDTESAQLISLRNALLADLLSDKVTVSPANASSQA